MVFTARNSCQFVALRLLSYLGIPDLAPAPTTSTPDAGRAYLTDGMLDEIAGIQTAVLQDIFEDGPASLSQIDTGGVLYPPAQITLNVTANNAATVPTVPLLPWMTGCSVIIQGDGYLNEFVNGLGRLRRPYLGPTATAIQATVYCNAVPLPINVKNVLEPVRVGNHQLDPCGDRAAFDLHGGCGFGWSYGLFQFGLPRVFYVDTIYDDTQSISPSFLRVAPAPSFAPLPISYKAKVLPQVINVEDLGDNTQDPAVFPNVPGQYVESILLPLCLQKWTGSSLFKNESAKPQIAAAAAVAKSRLASFKPGGALRKGGTQAFRA